MAVQVLATAFEAAGGAELKLRKLSLDGTLLGDASCMHLVKVGMRVCSCVSVLLCLYVGVLLSALLDASFLMCTCILCTCIRKFTGRERTRALSLRLRLSFSLSFLGQALGVYVGSRFLMCTCECVHDAYTCAHIISYAHEHAPGQVLDYSREWGCIHEHARARAHSLSP